VNTALDPGAGVQNSGEQGDSDLSCYGITESVLKASQNGATKFEIRSRTRLPRDLLDEVYLPYCLANEFLEHDEKSHVYHTTTKGKQFLKRYDTIKRHLRGEPFKKS